MSGLILQEFLIPIGNEQHGGRNAIARDPPVPLELNKTIRERIGNVLMRNFIPEINFVVRYSGCLPIVNTESRRAHKKRGTTIEN